MTVGERRNYCGLNRVSTSVYVVRTRATYLIIRHVALELRAQVPVSVGVIWVALHLLFQGGWLFISRGTLDCVPSEPGRHPQ